jgi:uncharacterized membrane protein YuzA (DUF378 family)
MAKRKASQSTMKRVAVIWAYVVAFNAGFMMFGPDLLGRIFGFLRFLPDLIDFIGMLAVLYLAFIALTK